MVALPDLALQVIVRAQGWVGRGHPGQAQYDEAGIVPFATSQFTAFQNEIEAARGPWPDRHGAEVKPVIITGQNGDLFEARESIVRRERVEVAAEPEAFAVRHLCGVQTVQAVDGTLVVHDPKRAEVIEDAAFLVGRWGVRSSVGLVRCEVSQVTARTQTTERVAKQGK